jgi:hypothetical protein
MWVRTVVDPPPAEVPVLLRSIGLRVVGHAESAVVPDGIIELPASVVADITYEVTGQATRVRDFLLHIDESGLRHGGAEFVLSVGGHRFQAMVNLSSASDISALGRRVTVTGRFSIVGDYEWDDEFDLEDTRADWQVSAAADSMLNMHSVTPTAGAA